MCSGANVLTAHETTIPPGTSIEAKKGIGDKRGRGCYPSYARNLSSLDQGTAHTDGDSNCSHDNNHQVPRSAGAQCWNRNAYTHPTTLCGHISVGAPPSKPRTGCLCVWSYGDINWCRPPQSEQNRENVLRCDEYWRCWCLRRYLLGRHNRGVSRVASTPNHKRFSNFFTKVFSLSSSINCEKYS